ncbi:MAG: branched-chain amino acid ABC transporter permease [Candidatus Dormibacteria bacterium]
MSTAWQFYISAVLIYLGVDMMACWGLNIQFGYAGLVNFSFIIFQAAGAYTAAVLTLGNKSLSAGQTFVGGNQLPFPLPILAAGVVGALLALLVGAVGLRRLRSDYEAMVMLVVSLIATSIATNDTGLVNGANGLDLVPAPLVHQLHLAPVDYQWLYVGITAVICLLVYAVVRFVTGSPFGRNLRAMRENEAAASALGRNTSALRMQAFVIGGAIAGISGAVLVQFISAWSPGAWLYPETFVYFTALIVGGSGNNLGAVVGALLVPVAFLEATRFIPPFGPPGFVDALQWIAIGLLAMAFLWFWPRGIIPERRRRFRRAAGGPAPTSSAPALRPDPESST